MGWNYQLGMISKSYDDWTTFTFATRFRSVCPECYKGNPCWWDQQFKKDWFTSFKNTPRNQMEHQHIKQTSISMKKTVETPGHQQLFPGALCLGRLDGMEWLHTSLRWWPTDTSSCYHSRGLGGCWTFGYPGTQGSLNHPFWGNQTNTHLW